jgi:hypothetical protein|tara:strand:- start:3661 stop:3888 length:228 start_codon:yes stop_codon:yes gene_type:complete
MTSKRQIRRNSEKREKKKVKKQMKSALNELATVPDKCSLCSESLDPKNNFHLDNWIITVGDEGVQMICNVCKVKG